MLDGSITVDHRLLSESGRAEIVQQQKDIPQNAEVIGKMTAAGGMSLGVAAAGLASGDQTLAQAYQTLMNPANTFDFVQKNPEAAAILNKFRAGEYDDIEAARAAMNQLAQVLGVNTDVLTTTITDVYGKKGTTDQNIIAIDVNPENRQGNVEVLGHEVSHNQGVSNEMLAHISGKATDIGFTSGITYNKENIDTFQKQIRDGKDAATQANNAVVLKQDNQQFFDQLNANPSNFEDYTTTNMAIAFSEKINTALKNNNQNEAKRLLNIYSDYMTKQYNAYQQADAKSIFAVPSVNVDGMTQQAKVPTFLNGEQLNQLFGMFPKGSVEYNEVQKLVQMQQTIYDKYRHDSYQGYYRGTDKVNFVYPDQANYGLLPDYYQKQGISTDPAYVQQIKADSSRGANAIIASAISPIGALGSATRIVGIDDKTADNLAIGGGLIGTVVGSGVATRTGGLNDTPLGKNEVVIPIKNISPVITNGRYDVNTLNTFKDLTTSLRSELNAKMKNSGNFGVAMIDIPGVQPLMASSSRLDSSKLNNNLINRGFVAQVDNPVFNSFSISSADGRLINRSTDTEAKILNNVAAQLGNNRSAKGTITLFTEREPCASCSMNIQQFREKYPNIKLDIVDSNGYLYTPNRSK